MVCVEKSFKSPDYTFFKYKIFFKALHLFTVFRGGDGSVFHPDILKNETLYVFNKDACQSIPIVFEKEIDSNGIPGYRYVTLALEFRFIVIQF